MKLYVISGLGADGSIFEYIQFPKKFTEIIYIDWLFLITTKVSKTMSIGWPKK